MMLSIVAAVLLSAPQTLELDPAAPQTVTYAITHPLHHVEGTTHKLKGAGRILPDGTVQAMVEAPAASFDSGNSNRDEHMRETVEAERFPTVVVKAIAKPPVPTSYPATVETQASLEVTLHGVAQRVTAPLKVSYASPTRITTVGHFTVSLDGFKVKRPSLLFTPIADACAIDIALSWIVGGHAAP